MGEAAKISLKAIGMQDTHLLSKDPEDSLFKYELNQYSNFTKLHRSKTVTKMDVDANWPFGKTVKVEFNPNQMGDLLSDMWIKLKMPNLNTSTNYPDQLSLHIIKSITMYVDGIKLEELTDDWNFIYNELYLSDTQREANQLNTNAGFNYTYFATKGENLGFFNRELLIPIHFFFSRKYDRSENRQYFPLCSINKQKIIFEIKFHKQSFFTDFSSNLSLPEFTIITEEIQLKPEERLYLSSSSHSYETDIVSKHLQRSSEVNRRDFKLNFSSDKPIKIFHWFYRFSEFENEDDSSKYKLRFNFTRNPNPFRSVDGKRFALVDRIKIYLNGESVQTVTGDQNHRYFKYYTPYKSGLNTPVSHIYTYNLSLYPSKQQQSGILDFRKIISDKSFIETALHRFRDVTKTYEMHVYHTAYTRFDFNNGFMNVVY
jgi:hypothetical protein